MLPLSHDLPLLLLEPLGRNAHLGVLRRDEQSPQLFHELRRVALEKARERYLHMTRIRELGSFEHIEDIFDNDVVLEAERIHHTLRHPSAEDSEVHAAHVHPCAERGRELRCAQCVQVFIAILAVLFR